MTFNFLNELTAFIQKSEFYIKPWLEVIGAIWCVNIINWIGGSRINYYFGLYPRNLFGLIGIPVSPFLHQNFAHLFFNTIPLFVLGLALLSDEGILDFCWITLFIVVIGGLGVWLFGRKAMHIGASGLISGYFGFILINAYRAPSLISVLLAVVAIYYFSGIFLGLFPGKKTISWESHLFGFLAGIGCAYIPNLLTYIIH